MKRLALLLLLFSFSLQAQVPFRFTLRYPRPKISTPLSIVLQSPDGRTDTIFSDTLRFLSKKVRNVRTYADDFMRQFVREIFIPGDYRLSLTLDTSTQEIPFSLLGDELMVEAGLSFNYYDSSVSHAFSLLNVYRPAPQGITLYYLGADTLQRKLLFHLVNQSNDTLYDGGKNIFSVDVQHYPDIEAPHAHLDYDGFPNPPLLPARSLKLTKKTSLLSPGRCRASVCFFTEKGRRSFLCTYSVGDVIYHSIWHHTEANIVYVATCDLFLTTIDLKN